jgi:hypothetical protein
MAGQKTSLEGGISLKVMKLDSIGTLITLGLISMF